MRPRIRSIKPEMWEDEKIAALSRDARLLLLGLVTMADDEGRFRARRSTIVGHVFPDDEDALRRVDRWIGEIKEQSIVLFYVVEGTPYGAFRHWKRHQKINKPNPSLLPPPPDPVVIQENSVLATGKGPEEAGSSKSAPEGSTIRSDPVLIRSLCEKLAARIRANDPKANPKPESDRWQTDMRLLVADRDGDADEVERIIDWCQSDSFWRSNILSPAKLRKQFTQLALKASSNVTPLRQRDYSHLPEGMRPSPEWVAQMEAHCAAMEGESA